MVIAATLVIVASADAAAPRSLIVFSSTRSPVLGPDLDRIDTRNGSVRRVPVPGYGATASPDGRRIAFVDATTGAHFGVYVARVGGGDRRLLFSSPNIPPYTDLGWSPDGRLIVFQVGERIALISPSGGRPRFVADARRLIWLRDPRQVAVVSTRDTLDLVNLNGGRIRGARPGLNGITDGDWSPDGRLFATIEADSGKLTVREARTHRVVLRTRGEAGPVRFSPDSRSVAFLEVRPSWTLVNYDLASGKRRILARRLHLSDEPPQPIEWSATGDRIAVACATSVIVVRRGGGRVLTFDHVWPLRHPIAPMRWIGSRTLVLTMAVQYNDREVYVADAATGKAKAITHNRVDDNHPVLAPDKHSVAYVRSGAVRIVQLDGSHDRRVHAGSSPAWSPSGELALVDRGKIELVDPVTGALRRVIVTGDEPDWAPDGSAIAYAYDGDIWAVAPDGSGPHPITSDPVFHRMPAYSPDGKRIAYRAVVENSAGTYAADAADGAHVTRLSDSGRDPSWSPDGSKVVLEYFDGTLRIVDSADGAHARTFSRASGWSGAPDWR